MRLPSLIAALCLPVFALAAEGMWTFDNLPLKKMQAEYGFTPGPGWVEHVMKSGVRLPGGCSASFISGSGLVMTNHHCAAECIEQLSSANSNFTQNGFLAAKREQELHCPNLELNRLEHITDVTDTIRQATAKLDGASRKQAFNAAQAKLTSACVGNDKLTIRCDVVELYRGGRYHLYRYHRYQDARLVWAPEKAAAALGDDLDNFNFPRYNLDITLLRAYENGQPVATPDFFRFNRQGAKEGEITFVVGNPGRTERLFTVAQLETLRDQILPQQIIRASELRGTLNQYMKSSPEAKRVAHETLFFLENGLKGRKGRLKALQNPEVMKKKQQDEAALQQFVASRADLKATTGGAWQAIAQAEQVKREIDVPYQLFEKKRAFDTQYFDYARDLVRAAQERSKANAERLPEFTEGHLPEVEEEVLSSAPIYAELETLRLSFALDKMREALGPDHPLVKRVLGQQTPEQLARSLIGQTKLADAKLRQALWQGGMAAISQSDDPFIKLALALDSATRQLRSRFETEVESVLQKNAGLIAQARFARDGTGTYPDATLTPRLSYGSIKGWREFGQDIRPFTDLKGAFLHDTGAEPFALPKSWWQAKDKLNLGQAVNFVSDHDIIGGNSGSPMINQKGEVVGLIFDGNIHSLGAAYWYDGKQNRAVSVHSGLILEVLDKVYGAKALVQEIDAK
jgi:hypothetical protein